ncbi:hypothetical protein BP6252_07700 [Coleophoma cylindrospora]|uniref:EF-hand domain-containing protein n=1 Tax=Coleophoma cylindrospora TaxID=1849047 RepID=A0A3D8RAQ8_9HELO|nr:hypothetical protein BP6252_07700 [Coleophoma cylindrospora]
MSSTYKPSPLSYGSPQRNSPFRRPESPASPSPLRQSTPNPSPTKQPAANVTPSRLAQNTTPTSGNNSWTPRGHSPVPKEPERSPGRASSGSPKFGGMLPGSRAAPSASDMNALGKLQPAQVRELREGFQVLDRDSDGQVGREDVADMLNQLGLPSGSSDLSLFFPPGSSQTIPLPTFLNSIANLLASLSPSSELLSAFSAFDDDDSGQIDLVELRDALLHTAPEPGETPLTDREVDRVMSGFTGRRAFSKHSVGSVGKRGEVFKYQEFVASVAGGASVDGKATRNGDD